LEKYSRRRTNFSLLMKKNSLLVSATGIELKFSSGRLRYARFSLSDVRA
jgi:hypothetical protein